ncbi:hypothetical protein E2542_SST12926 [Spatholobus suberectus]|nr:hypothetical protein E2542_SST12926 [Spatholobus suberectus]
MASGTQSTGMLPREQLFHLFDRFIFLTSQPGTLLSFPDLVFCFLIDSLLPFDFFHFGNLRYLSADVKKRIAEAVRDKQEAVAVTTAIQEEIFLEMGVDPRFGISCLGRVSTVCENDQGFGNSVL